jgi:hypothetical protein
MRYISVANNTEVTDFDILVILIVMLKGHDLHRGLLEKNWDMRTMHKSNNFYNFKMSFWAFHSTDPNDIFLRNYFIFGQRVIPLMTLNRRANYYSCHSFYSNRTLVLIVWVNSMLNNN